MMYGRGADTDTRADLSARLASLLTASLESCNSAEMKLTLVGALSVDMPRTPVGLIWRLRCAEVRLLTISLGKAIELLQALLDDVGGQYR